MVFGVANAFSYQPTLDAWVTIVAPTAAAIRTPPEWS